MAKGKIQHLRSAEDKTPSSDALVYGEIAMSYSANNPSLFIKDSNDKVVRFPAEATINNTIDDKTKDCIRDVSNLVTKEEFEPVSTAAYGAIPQGTLATINNQTIEEGGNITIDLSLYKVVSTLPDTFIDVNKIYLVPNSQSTEEKNVFDEYIYNAGWELLGQFKSDIDLSGYLKTADADKKYVTKSTGGDSSISISSTGSFNNYGNNGQAFNAVRDCANTLTSKRINAASFGVKLDGTTAFSHKTYDTFNPTTGAYTGARNTAVLTFSGPTGLRYALNTGSANDVTDAMYRYVGIIDSQEERNKVYSAKQVDDIISGLTSQIETLKQAVRDLGGTI